LEAFDAIYDSHLACSLFAAWKQDTSDKEAVFQELLLQLAPLVTIVSRSVINPAVGDANIEVLKMEAWEYVFFTLTQEYVPSHIAGDHRTFTGYFWTMIKIALIKSFHRTCDPQVFDFSLVCEESPPAGRVTRHEDTEILLYLDQFNNLVLSTATHDIRFQGKEKEACVFIGKCLLGLIDLHPLSARFRYSINKSRATFLVQYMQHLLKQTAYKVKQIDEAIGVTGST
jgi:hypothetical protein